LFKQRAGRIKASSTHYEGGKKATAKDLSKTLDKSMLGPHTGRKQSLKNNGGTKKPMRRKQKKDRLRKAKACKRKLEGLV